MQQRGLSVTPLQVERPMFCSLRERQQEQIKCCFYKIQLVCLYFYGQEEIDDCKSRINIPMLWAPERWRGAII